VSVAGVHKWLGRVWRAVNQVAATGASGAGSDLPSEPSALRRLVHRTIQAVTGDYERTAYNVAISKLMTLTAELRRAIDAPAGAPGRDLREAAEALVLLLAPMAPHICEELWREALGHAETMVFGPWPAWDEDLAREDEVVLVVQVDGRVRDRLSISADADEERSRAAAMASERVRRSIQGREVARVVVRPPRLVNIVTRA
jgi:leucyl-tRNA synthetase